MYRNSKKTKKKCNNPVFVVTDKQLSYIWVLQRVVEGGGHGWDVDAVHVGGWVVTIRDMIAVLDYF